jgi:hypothetical protein
MGRTGFRTGSLWELPLATTHHSQPLPHRGSLNSHGGQKLRESHRGVGERHGCMGDREHLSGSWFPKAFRVLTVIFLIGEEGLS